MEYLQQAGYRFGFTQPLSEHQRAALIALLQDVPVGDHTPLGGRGGVAIRAVDGLGSVAVKRYVRGGILRAINAQYYLAFGPSRPQVEFELLERVRGLGVNAPEPIACVTRGRLWYEGWLVMREIPSHRRLSDPGVVEEHGSERLFKEISRQVKILISHRILHIDLHPGNVLIDNHEVVHLIDFDNACAWKGRERDLRDQYLRRWRRAVIKHRLPETLSELMAAELRQVAAQGC
jgi:3-deoxy-D-manno-octulosonic acid kinase